jgi:hypothetical protein
MRKNRGSISAI